MAKLVDIIAIEKERADATQQRRVHLFVDGSFYRAYDWSAWLCCTFISTFKVTRKYNKSVDADVFFIGFPQASLEKFTPEGCNIETIAEGHLVLTLPESLLPSNGNNEETYLRWRETIPLAETKIKTSLHPLADRPVSMTGIMKKVMEYNVLEHSPIECM